MTAGVSVVEQRLLANSLRVWLRLLRVRQWSKNLMLCVALFLGQQFTDIAAVALTAGAFLLFSLLASGTYILNDIHDVNVDRHHPTKRNRPLAAGAIQLNHARLVALALIAISLSAAALLFPWGFFVVLVSYLLLTLAYTSLFKKVALADANVIGILFTLRVVAGMIVLGQPISLWLTSFAATLFTSFALAKRQAEFSRIAASGSARATGRAYETLDLPAILAFGVSYAVASMLIMLLYFNFEVSGKGLYRTPEWLYIIPAILMLWISRVWLLAQRGVLDEDPVEFALTDPVSWMYGGAVLAVWALAVFQ